MTESRYSSVAVTLHWVIALLIITQIAGGLYMHKLPDSAAMKFDLYQLHKSFGLSILTLTIVRLSWRLTHRAPPLPTAMPGWQKLAARSTHWGFYALLLLTPFAGWAMVSVSPTDIPTMWFGLFSVPHLPFFDGVANREAAEDIFKDRHKYLAFSILFLLALHVAAALKHGFVNRDGVLRSMAPATAGAWLGAALILGGLGAGAISYWAAGQKTIRVIDPSPVDIELPADMESLELDDVLAGETTSSAEPAIVADAAASDPALETAATGAWIVDYGGSKLGFVATQTGNSFEGRFEKYDAAIVFDPADLSTASIDVTIDMTSAKTGDRQRDSALPGSDWFKTKEFPTARFQSTEITETGEGAYAAKGTLTLRGVTQPITLPFTLDITGDTATAAGEVTLIRTDFGVGQGEFATDEFVGLEVKVTVDVKATR